MKIECEYCHKRVEQGGIGRHHKTKACLTSQGRIVVDSAYECEWCGEGFQRADVHKKHVTRCKHKDRALHTSTEDRLRMRIRSLESELASRDSVLMFRDSEIEEHDAIIAKLELENKLLQKEISVLKACPPVVNNITNNNIRVDKFVVQEYAKDNFVPLTEGLLKECLSVGVDPMLLLRGPEAVAQLILETSLEGRDKFACTDASRSVCHWKEIDHTVITDMKMKKLMPRLVRPIYGAYSAAWRSDTDISTDEYQAVGEVVSRLRSISVGKDVRSKYYNALARQIMDAKCDLLYMVDEEGDWIERDEES